jgi:predicted phosphoribosyltransferase
MSRQFADRRDAGRQLAAALGKYRNTDAVVLALPRGGVPVGYEVARALGVPLAVFVVRKLGTPGQRELAMGAIASGGVRVLNDQLISDLGIPPEVIDAVAAEEERELKRRELLYGSTVPELRNRTVILVDDGLATGATMRAAVRAARLHGPARIVVAVPVGASDTCDTLRREADELHCLRMPEPFSAVGLWYSRFDQTTDDEVRTLIGEVTEART